VKALLFLARHRAVVWLGTAVLVLLGLASAFVLPSGIYPEVEFPRIVVVARTGGAPPDVFLTRVTRPLEQVLASVLGVQRVRSKTIRGATEISLHFAADTDMWRALQLTESRVAEIRSSLPADAEVIVERVTTGSFPVVTFNVSGPRDPRELRELAEFVMRPALANVPGVGRIEVLGGDIREIEIILNPESTAALRLTPLDVAAKLKSGMGLTAVGRVEQNRQLVTVLADALPRTVAEIEDMPVAVTADGASIPLSSVAEVVEGHEDRLVRIGGPAGEAVGVSVARLPGASTPAVVEAAISAVRALGPSLVGIALCALVIALFLRDFRAGLLSAITIPTTLAISFVAMRIAHQSLNLMSLGGMAVAIGLVVDDAIVTVEAIARHRDAGADPKTAAIAGTAELAPAVTGTTLTTVVVLIPMAFLRGLVGDFFRALAFTLGVAVVVSLGVALVLVPLAAGSGLSQRRSERKDGIVRVYDRVTRKLVSRPWFALAGFFLLLAVGVVLAPRLRREFLPSMDEGAFVLDYFLPAGTSLDTTERLAKELEQELKETPEVLTFTRRTGAELGPAAATQLSRGDVMVRLGSPGTRARKVEAIVSDLRARIESRYPEVRVEFVQVLQDVLNDLSGSPRPIEVKIFGQDFGVLYSLADTLAARIRDVPGLVDVYGGHERDTPELRFAVQRDALSRLGTTPDEVAQGLETTLLGSHVGDIRRFDRLVGVRVRYPNPTRFDPFRVLDLPFLARDQVTTFRAVAEIHTTESPSELLHEALQPVVAVTGDHEERDLGSVSDDVEKIARGLELPPGYRIAFGGQMESQRETLRDLAAVGSLALLLVVTVLAGQFERLRLAVLVVGAVPAAVVGAIVALAATSTPLNASSLMGCVLLVGLVVKNGVLLLEETERRLGQGEAPLSAVALAGERRLRPVIMTTVATLAGLLPLALGIGAGAELQRPLAIAVIGGLLTSTVATLALVPPLAAWMLGSKRSPSLSA
jgi:multidrug efflux pump subunit AcrB